MINVKEGRATVRTEVSRVISDMFNQNIRAISKRAIVDRVLDRWLDFIEGEAADLAKVALYDMVWSLVGKQMNDDKHAGADETQPQLILEGWKHLQKLYVVGVDGEQMYIDIESMTDDQIQDKAEEHRKIGRGNLEHADELERYLVTRSRKTA